MVGRETYTMNIFIRSKILLWLAAFLGGFSIAQAQLYVATGNTGVTTWFNFSVDPVLNRLTVVVDNTHAGAGGVGGTVTSFGFNIPSSLAGTGSLISATGVPAETWSFFEPYDLNAGGNVFQQDVGAGSGKNPNGGQPNESIAFGSMATFIFQFADFNTVAGFLGDSGVTARWQAIGPGGLSDQGFGVSPPVGAAAAVPEPSTYGALSALILAAICWRQKYTRRVEAIG
jgi:hypothetical protein